MKVKKLKQSRYRPGVAQRVFRKLSFPDFVTLYEGNKIKAVPLQAWTGPEGSRKLRFPDFVTLYEGKKVKAVPLQA